MIATSGCAGVSQRESHSNAPMSNVHLRNSFDTDPSVYLGRFVPRDATDLDEGTAMPLTCSQFVKYRGRLPRDADQGGQSAPAEVAPPAEFVAPSEGHEVDPSG